MFDKISQLLFLLFFFLILLFEGLGFRYGREISFVLIVFAPFALFLVDYINNVKIKVPKVMTVLFVLFIFFSSVSTLYSGDIQRSFEYLLFQASLFLIFIYMFNHKQLSKLVIVAVFILSFIFISYSLAINYLLPKNWFWLIPSRGYQYVYAFYKTHNPLGEFLLVPLIVSIYNVVQSSSNKYLILSVIILPFFYLSYSRSAYLSLIIGSLSMLFFCWKYKKRLLEGHKGLMLVIVILASFILFFTTVKYSSRTHDNIGNKINSFLAKHFKLSEKNFFARRDQYFVISLKSIKENLFFGTGPGNFIIASRRFAFGPNGYAETADNIILETFVENGLFAGLIFILVIVVLFKNHSRNKLLLFFPLVVMLFLFQTSSVQRYYSYLFMFFIIAGLQYEDDYIEKGPSYIFNPSLLLAIIIILVIISKIFYSFGYYKVSYYFYPFCNQCSKQAVFTEFNQGNYRSGLMYLSIYSALTSKVALDRAIIAGIYNRHDNKKQALLEVKRAFEYDPYNFFIFLQKYNYEKEVLGRTYALNTAHKYFAKMEKAKLNNDYPWGLYRLIKRTCNKIYNACPYKL